MFNHKLPNSTIDKIIFMLDEYLILAFFNYIMYVYTTNLIELTAKQVDALHDKINIYKSSILVELIIQSRYYEKYNTVFDMFDTINVLLNNNLCNLSVIRKLSPKIKLKCTKNLQLWIKVQNIQKYGYGISNFRYDDMINNTSFNDFRYIL